LNRSHSAHISTLEGGDHEETLITFNLPVGLEPGFMPGFFFAPAPAAGIAVGGAFGKQRKPGQFFVVSAARRAFPNGRAPLKRPENRAKGAPAC